MMWDKLFWLWFVITAVLALMLVLEEATTLSLLFGSMVIGLGLIKLAGERAERERRPLVKRRILDKLMK
jgi:hypothetical protein